MPRNSCIGAVKERKYNLSEAGEGGLHPGAKKGRSTSKESKKKEDSLIKKKVEDICAAGAGVSNWVAGREALYWSRRTRRGRKKKRDLKSQKKIRKSANYPRLDDEGHHQKKREISANKSSGEKKKGGETTSDFVIKGKHRTH